MCGEGRENATDNVIPKRYITIWQKHFVQDFHLSIKLRILISSYLIIKAIPIPFLLSYQKYYVFIQSQLN